MGELEARKLKYPTTGTEAILMGILIEGKYSLSFLRLYCSLMKWLIHLIVKSIDTWSLSQLVLDVPMIVLLRM